MNAEYLNALREQFGFQDWAMYQPPQSGALTVWRFAFSGGELGPLRLLRTDRVQLPPDMDRPDVVATAHALWDGAEGEMLRVDAFECVSGWGARETLLRVMGQYQGASMLTRVEEGPGEIAFEGPNGFARLFARGNMVIQLRNAGRRLVPVAEHAQRMDALLASRPNPDALEGLGMRTAVIQPQELEPLVERAEATFHEGGPAAAVWFRFFAKGSVVMIQRGRPTYHPMAGATEPQSITVYMVELPRKEPGADASSIFPAR